MKKILLFLLLVTYSFSIDGFDKLKWESSPEDFYKYYNNYNYYTSDNSYFTLIDPDIYFEGEKFIIRLPIGKITDLPQGVPIPL